MFDKATELKSTANTSRLNSTRINSFVGIKAIALILIFIWHSPIKFGTVDLGARCCEVFFVVSGFLAYWNYNRKDLSVSLKTPYELVKKRLIELYPLHIFGFIAMAGLFATTGKLSKKSIVPALMNITLTQAWSNNSENAMSFNGLSWFVSALIFCTLVSPLVYKYMKRVPKRIAFTFAVMFIIRIGTEYIQVNDISNAWHIHFHVNPFIRFLEFAMGMTMGGFAVLLRERAEAVKITPSQRFVASSVIEAVVLIGVSACFILSGNSWLRSWYIVLLCIFTLVFSFDGGLISRFFGNRLFCIFGKIQTEVYLLHIVVLYHLNFLKASISNIYIYSLIVFAATVLISIIYSKLLKKPAQKLMKAAFKLFEKIFF